MHVWQANLGGLGLQLPFNASVAAFLGLYLGATLLRISKQRLLFMSPILQGMMFLVLAFFLMYPIHMLMDVPSYAPFQVFLFMFCGWLYLLCLHVSVRGEPARDRLVLVLLLAVVIQSLISIGWASHVWFVLGRLDFTKSNLLFGVFQQPNVLASLLATGLACGFLYLSKVKKEGGSGYLAYFVAATPVLFMPLLVVLQSRIGWLGTLLVLILVVLWRLTNRQSWSYLHKIWCSALALGAVAGALLLHFAAAVRRDIGNIVEATGNHRTHIWEITWSMIKDNPLFGVGYGRFEVAFLQHQADYYAEHGVYAIPNLTHPHNELLMWGAEGGMLLMGTIVFFVLWMLRRWWQHRSADSLLYLAVLAPIAAHSMTELPFNLSLPHWLFFLSALYLLEPESTHVERRMAPAINYAAIAGVLLALINFTFMAGVLQAGHATINSASDGKNKEQAGGSEVMLPFAVHTVWQRNIQKSYMAQIYKTAIDLNDAHIMEEYIRQAEMFLTYSPRYKIHQSLVSAYQALGKEEEAKAARARMDHLYPPAIFASSNDGKSKVTVHTPSEAHGA
jgi:O-antigen polymerase